MSKKPLFVHIALSDITFDASELIGAGRFGSVYKATWHGQVVAMKKTLCFDQEASLLAELSHRNIVKFHGACTQAPNFFLVTEFAENGSLYSFLENYKLEYEQILTWAGQIAAGMYYLHDGAPQRIVHRDLKSPNVLVSAAHVLQICDFGASRAVGVDSIKSGGMVGTIAWMAPEVIRQDGSVNEKCDVWSYGVILWELLTSLAPYDGLEPFAIMVMVGRNNISLPIPESCPDTLSALLHDCWQQMPSQRPAFKELIDRVESLGHDADFPTELTAFLRSRSHWQEKVEEIIENYRSLQHEQDRLSLRLSQVEEREMAVATREMVLAFQLHSHATQPPRSPSSGPESRALVPSPRVKPSKQPEFWTEREVVAWVGVLPDGLHEYADVFRRNNIKGRLLLRLTTADLVSMGVVSLGHRADLLEHIAQIKRAVEFPPLTLSWTPASSVAEHDDLRTVLILLSENFLHSPADHRWTYTIEAKNEGGSLVNVIDYVQFTVISRQKLTPHTVIARAVPFIVSGNCSSGDLLTVTTSVTYIRHFRRKTTKLTRGIQCASFSAEAAVQLSPKQSALSHVMVLLGHGSGAGTLARRAVQPCSP